MRKPAAPRDLPPPLELTCLRALWRGGQGSVRDIQARLAADKELAYTTVMTLLDRLTRRGFVERNKNGRAFIYAPLLGEKRARAIAVQDLVDAWFDGSREFLAEHLGQAQPEPTPHAQPAPPPPPVHEEQIDTTLL